MTRLVPALVLLTSIGVPVTTDPGPIPTCNGERATHVLVEFGTAHLYGAWEEAGVDVQANEDDLLRGTVGHDVLVALVATDDGGIVSDPFPASHNPDNLPTAGDTICARGTDQHGSDVIYASIGQPDWIDTGAGSDDIYAGGGGDIVYAGPGTDFIWGYQTGDGVTQRIFGGRGQDHNYVGAGTGTVRVRGGAAPADVLGGGDHVHPCGRVSDIVRSGIEYVGTETALGLPPQDAADPCAYQFRNF